MMERERQLEAQKPRRGSLVDPYLIEQYYGPPSLKNKKELTSKKDEGSPSPSKDEEEEEEETHSEATPPKTTPIGDEPWADTDSEDEELEVCPYDTCTCPGTTVHFVRVHNTCFLPGLVCVHLSKFNVYVPCMKCL